MQRVVGKKEAARRATEERQSAAAKPLAGGLSLYAEPPAAEVRLEDFERFAVARLRVLKGIEDGFSRGKRPDELEGVIARLVESHLPTVDPVTLAVSEEGLYKDAVSHFVLRLAYCRTEELRRWFLQQECALFKYRFKHLTSEAQVRFLSENGLRYQPISAQEFAEIRERLRTVMEGQMRREEAREATDGAGAAGFYRVPFEEVPELVKARRVYVRGGQAYVPRDHLNVLVVGTFRARLSKALVQTSRKWAAKAGEEADRLAPVVESLSTRYLGSDYSKGGATAGGAVVARKDLDALAQRHFPLCARNLFNKLKEDSHLRYQGRQQLGLFLKGLGLPLEEALAFWKSEFCKSGKMTGETWEKQHAYNVRHNYGKEGKRADYTPFSCQKTISYAPGVGEHHGCPFRTFREENLRAALGQMRLSAHVVADVMNKVKGQHYQLACGAVFEGVNGTACEAGIQHPNQYVEESRALAEQPASAGADTAGAPVTPAASRAQTRLAQTPMTA